MFIITLRYGLRKCLVVLRSSSCVDENLRFGCVAEECVYDYGRAAIIDSLARNEAFITSYGISVLAVFNEDQVLLAYQKAQDLADKVAKRTEGLPEVVEVYCVELEGQSLNLTLVEPKDIPSPPKHYNQHTQSQFGSVALARRFHHGQ